MTEGCSKNLFSWWKTSSGSTRLLWFLVPLILMSGLFVLGGFSEASNLYPWIFWNASLIRSTSSTTNTPLTARGPISLQDQNGDQSPAVDGGKRAEPPSDYKNLNQSTASPPQSIPVKDSRQPPVSKEEVNLNVTETRTFIIPSFNQTHPLPKTATTKKRFSNLERLEARLAQARFAIKDAKNRNQTDDPSYTPFGPIYNNAKAFHRSYLEMEKHFKVYVYGEGEPPIFHDGPCRSIYSTEGNFIYKMETTRFRTRDPNKAHTFFLPFSVASMVSYIYEKDSHVWGPLRRTVKDYVYIVSRKYPYWNRSLGADHFMLACHDWGPELSRSDPKLFKNSIRALCNANTSEGFNPTKDVSIPEILLPTGTTEGLLGGPSPSKRPYLVFFAGGVHGPVRPLLLQHWEGKDEDVQVHRYLEEGVSYYGMLRKSKYCICASGYEVASPRMVEALYTGCVPVLIKDHYVAPFSDVLNWKSFSVVIPVEDIPNMKTILNGISSSQYIRMQRRGKQVRRHFELNHPPERYDVFHMILHSIWLRRLNIRLHSYED